MISADLFARYLDLAPLGRRRRGLVRCRFHEDRSPSLSVDLARGLFHCFGCGVGGGLATFAALVGERSAARPAPIIWESPRDRARRDVLAEAQRHAGQDEDTRARYVLADALRVRYRAVAEARRIATRAGDRPEVWALLARAAAVEIDAHGIEAALDEAP
jgi:DNA primase